MKVVCIVQARVGSTRLPGKILKKICGKTVLEHDVNRLKLVPNIDEIVIATTTEKQDDKIIDEANRLGVKYFRGSENDVLSRYYFAAMENNADIVVRVTSDCPLLDCNVCAKVIRYYIDNKNFDYVSNTINRTYPRGLDIEVFSITSLEKAYINAEKASEREHVTPFIWRNNEIFRIGQVCNNFDNSDLRLTLDTDEDFKLIKNIYEKLYINCKYFGLEEILLLYDQEPKLFEINRKVKQKDIEV